MTVDNALDADELSSQRYLNEISNNMVKPPQVTSKKVPASHEILSLYLTTLPAFRFHKTSECFPIMGILINSRLASLDLIPTHTTNIVSVSGKGVHDARYDNRNRSSIEQSYYVLSRDECKNIISSGAYDEPNSWNRKLNDQMKGFDYDRLTRVKISKYHMYDNPSVNVMGLGKPPEGRSLNFVMVKNDEPWAYFSEDTDNSFSLLLASAVHQISKDYQDTGTGFKISRAVADYGNREASRFTRYLSTGKFINSNKVENDVDMLRNSQRNPQQNTVDENGYVNKDQYKKFGSSAVAPSDFHVSKKEHTVAHELNLNAKPESSLSDDRDLENRKTVTESAHSINNELDLKTDKVIHHSISNSAPASNHRSSVASSSSSSSVVFTNNSHLYKQIDSEATNSEAENDKAQESEASQEVSERQQQEQVARENEADSSEQGSQSVSDLGKLVKKSNYNADKQTNHNNEQINHDNKESSESPDVNLNSDSDDDLDDSDNDLDNNFDDTDSDQTKQDQDPFTLG